MLGPWLSPLKALQLLDELGLLGSELTRHLNLHGDIVVSPLVRLAEFRHAPAAYPHARLGLRPGWDLDLGATVNSLHHNAGAQQRVEDADGGLGVDVEAVALEVRGGGDLDRDVEITCRPTTSAFVALAPDAQLVPVSAACRHLHGHLLHLCLCPLASAAPAECGGIDAVAAAGGADLLRLHHPQRCLHHLHRHPGAPTLPALCVPHVLLGPPAIAVAALLLTPDLH
mmetsp:Transcript_31899/g.43161  ORF Transcript_31899/g.43161 Transcript_31899/m.43161 type:complete len:227 (-) Transcript_31899:248-928(-)